MTQNLIDSAISITVYEANRFRKATAYVAYRDADGRIQRTTHPVSQVDELVTAIRATGVAVEEEQMWKRIEVTIQRPRPEYVTPAMTAEDQQWLAAQQRMASYAPSGRGTRASFANRLAISRGRGAR
jgi:hypothetical protein